ncbi:MAG: aspartate carbamoyltransferase [Nitrospinota bacterium]
MRGRNLITIDDFSNREIEAVLDVAAEMDANLHQQGGRLPGAILASLFFEPSTRTRLSFDTAMLRLGGRVVSATDVQASSIAKGESLADTARVVSKFTDLIVIRHPGEGSARLMAEYSHVPVVNAGDGGHEHPTQTLLDLYTLRKEKGRLRGLTVALCGDLKNGRTIHSLAYALARFGSNLLCMPGEGLSLPEYVTDKLRQVCGSKPEVARLSRTSKPSDIRTTLAGVDVVVLPPHRPHQLSLFTQVEEDLPHILTHIDALYVTRVQKERFGEGTSRAKTVEKESAGETGGRAETGAAGKRTKEGPLSYPVVNRAFLKGQAFRKTVVMHPLPRVDELAYEVDEDPRSRYFEQAARGVPVRMALIALLLGAYQHARTGDSSFSPAGGEKRIYRSRIGVRCANERCVSRQEARYVTPQFWVIELHPPRLRCVYCDRDLRPAYAGNPRSRRYCPADRFPRPQAGKGWVLFACREEAEQNGFRPSRDSAARTAKT